MELNNQIQLELYFADHFDTILFSVLADIYLNQDDLKRARRVCEIGLRHHEQDVAGLFVLALVEKAEGNLKESEKVLEKVMLYDENHLAALELLCEIQTVLGRDQAKLLKSWQHVLKLDPDNRTEADFVKKATGRTKFTCTEGQKLFRAVDKTITTKQPQVETVSSFGCDEHGEIVAKFEFTWSFKQR